MKEITVDIAATISVPSDASRAEIKAAIGRHLMTKDSVIDWDWQSPQEGNAVARRKPCKVTRDYGVEERILGSVERLSDGVTYARYRLKGPWPAWEVRILQEAHHNPDLLLPCVAYARNVLASRWPELEPLLLPCRFTALKAYMESGVLGRKWDFLEDTILRSRSLYVGERAYYAFLYATLVKGEAWSPGERIILDAATDPDSAVMMDDPTRICSTEYSIQAIRGRWPSLERMIERGACTPWVGVDYAEKVLGKAWPKLESALASTPASPELDMATSHYLEVFPSSRPIA